MFAHFRPSLPTNVLVDGEVNVDCLNVTRIDIRASNGMINLIDAVMIPLA